MLLKSISYPKYRPCGFTLPELLLATSLGTFIVFVTLAFLRNIASDYSSSSARQSLQDQSSTALDLIATEVRSSSRISTYLGQDSDKPIIDNKCLPNNMGDYLFSIELPRQALQGCIYIKFKSPRLL